MRGFFEDNKKHLSMAEDPLRCGSMLFDGLRLWGQEERGHLYKYQDLISFQGETSLKRYLRFI